MILDYTSLIGDDKGVIGDDMRLIADFKGVIWG